MRKTFWFTCAAAICAVTTGVATQTPDSSTQAKGKTITVSGCLQRAAETGAAGTAGTTGSSAAATKFELTNAMIAGGAAGSATGAATGTPEAAGTSGRAAAATTYRLDGTDTQLAGHVSHKVEITGTLDDPSAMGSASGTTGTPSETAGTAGAKATAPRLKVQSVKMVAATCP